MGKEKRENHSLNTRVGEGTEVVSFFVVRDLTVTATAAECSTQLAVLVGEVEDGLGKISRLDYTADLDGAFIFDEFAD